MWNHFIKKLQFLLKSTNQHGVHSPFVYSYLTEGIYQTKKKYKNFSKEERILQASIDYFQVKEKIDHLKNESSTVKNLIKSQSKDTYKQLYYINDLGKLNDTALQQLAKTANKQTIIYINKPYSSEKSEKNWSLLQTKDNLKVSIDFYIAGLIFTREEQRKEHFTLRV